MVTSENPTPAGSGFEIGFVGWGWAAPERLAGRPEGARGLGGLGRVSTGAG